MELCSICKDEMTLEQNYMLSCNHRFHTSCIIDSLRKNPECPVCRDTGGVKKYNNGYYNNGAYNNGEYNNGDYTMDGNSFDNYIHMQHSDFCVHCSIKNKQSNYYDIYSTLYEIIDNDDSLFTKKNNAIKTVNHIRKKILMINSEVKNDVSQFWKDTLFQLDDYYNTKTHSIEFVDILDKISHNKPQAQQFGKLLLDKLHELDINKDNDVITVINYITYQLYNCPFTQNNKFFTCYKNSFCNKTYFNKLQKFVKRNKTVNNTKINVIV